MTRTSFYRNNHYVSQGYLKRWESSPDKVWVYQLLVSHQDVPLWTKKSTRGVAFQQHLYTRKIAGEESDEIEKWFSQEYESPAEEAIQKAVTDQRLTPSDWKKLVRFLAMQDVRTPARLLEHLNSSVESTPKILEDTLKELPAILEANKESGGKIPLPGAPSTDSSLPSGFPLRVTTEVKEGEEFVTLKAETAIGRASWLWSVQFLLQKTANILHMHKWTILRPAKGMYWLTSDKPVVRLNYYGAGKYDFGGGWGKNGTELFLPLGPEHLLYTRIGHRAPVRGTRFSIEQTHLIRRLLAEHTDRRVFAHFDDPEIPNLIPRKVDDKLFKDEREQWDNWHEEQNKSEKHLLAERTKGDVIL